MKIIKLDATDSTNTYLKLLARKQELKDETIVVTEKQIAGRGQQGNSWRSIAGQSLCFSMFKRFTGLKAQDQFAISMLVSLALVKVMKDFNLPQVTVKWPNDIMSGDKKIGGILIENVLEGNLVKYSVIGIGINVNETSFENLANASSMRLQTGESQHMEVAFTSFTNGVLRGLKRLENADVLDFKEEYEEELFKKDLVSVFQDANGNRFNGMIKGVSDIGELLIETESVTLKTVQVKELKLLF